MVKLMISLITIILAENLIITINIYYQKYFVGSMEEIIFYHMKKTEMKILELLFKIIYKSYDNKSNKHTHIYTNL